MPKHEDITVELVSGDSNAMAIVGTVVQAIKDAGRDGRLTPSEAKQSIADLRTEAYSGDYDHLLQTCMEWVNVE